MKFLRPVHRFVLFMREVGRRFIVDDSFKLAASLAYTTLLALVPLVTIGFAVFSAFPAFKTFTVGVNEFISHAMLPSTVEQIVATHLDQFTRSAGRLTALGIVVLGITAILLMQTIDAALQRIFAVRRKRPLILRVLTYWGVLTLGPLLIGASLSMTSYLLTHPLIGNQYVHSLVLRDVVPLALTAIAFTLLYKVVPNRKISTRHALIGGVCAALLFETMKRGFAFYIAQFPTYTLIYGAFAAIPIFLLWIYLSWLVVLLGAVLAATLPERRSMRMNTRGTDLEKVGERLRDLVAVLRVLVQAQRARAVLTSGTVASRAQISLPLAEMLLDALERERWAVRASGGERWALSCDPNSITLAQVYERVLFGDPLDDEFVKRVQRLDREALNVPLTALDDDAAELPSAISSPR